MNNFASRRCANLFLAAVPDASTAARIHLLASELKRAHRFDGRLIAPERLHISLFALGGLPEGQHCAAWEAAMEVRTAPFEVAFDRAASFRERPGNHPSSWSASRDCMRCNRFGRRFAPRWRARG